MCVQPPTNSVFCCRIPLTRVKACLQWIYRHSQDKGGALSEVVFVVDVM